MMPTTADRTKLGMKADSATSAMPVRAKPLPVIGTNVIFKAYHPHKPSADHEGGEDAEDNAGPVQLLPPEVAGQRAGYLGLWFLFLRSRGLVTTSLPCASIQRPT